MKNDAALEKLRFYAKKVMAYCEGKTYESFSADSMLAEACVFNLGQMGEIARRVDSDFKDEHPEIPWRVINGLRNRIVHDYEGVNMRLIWEIINNDLPELIDKLNNISI